MKKILATLGVASVAVLLGAGVANGAPLDGGKINPDAIGSITINKFAGSPWENGVKPADATPLQGVEFTLCKVNLDITDHKDRATLYEVSDKVLETGALPNTVSCGESTSITTGEDGKAVFSNLPVGAYFIQETETPAEVAEHTLPFIATVPTSENNEWVYDVEIYPKNAVVDIKKDVDDPGAATIDSPAHWSISTVVPLTQRPIESYILGDTLDSRLEYVKDSSTLSLGGKTFDPSLYSLTQNGQELRITLNQEGLNAVSALSLDKSSTEESRTFLWEFDSKVVSIGNGVIENDATVWVNNPSGTGKTSLKVSSNWGSAKLLKHAEKSDTGLKGAIFQVFGSKEAADTCAKEVQGKNFEIANGCSNSLAIGGNKFFESDSEGIVLIEGLSVGTNDEMSRTYWATEIKAPEGYVLGQKSVEFVVTPGDVTSAEIVAKIPNALTPKNPITPTGTDATWGLLGVASVLIAGAIFISIGMKRSKKNED